MGCQQYNAINRISSAILAQVQVCLIVVGGENCQN